MANHPGFTINYETARRVGRIVRDYEAGRLTNRDQEAGENLTPGPGGFWVVAGTTATGWPAGYHNGKLLFADPYTGEWYESPEAVLVYELNENTLTEGQKYQGNFLETVTKDGSATAVFSVNKGGAGNTLDCPHVSGVVCTGGYLAVTYGTGCDSTP
jgi:hypothetical protein